MDEGHELIKKAEDAFKAEWMVKDTWIGKVSFLEQHGDNRVFLEMTTTL